MTNILKCSLVKENKIKHEQNADDCKSKGHQKDKANESIWPRD